MGSRATEERIERERAFHDQRFEHDDRRSNQYYVITDGATADYEGRLHAVARPGARVLEYGCGTGSAAFGLAARGAEVTAIDISPVAIAIAEETAAAQGVADRCDFVVMDAEELDLPSGSVDLVCGSGILHHLDLERALPELARVLAPGGRGVFFEPLGHNPVVNLYRRLTPEERTDDEHPLLEADLVAAHRWFGDVHATAYELTSLLALPLRRTPAFGPLADRLHALDAALFGRRPRLQRWAWTVVVELARPLAATDDG